MKIWPDGLPNSNGADLTKPYDDATGNYEPTVRVYLPEKSKATGRAILCIPGGGYGTRSVRARGLFVGAILRGARHSAHRAQIPPANGQLCLCPLHRRLRGHAHNTPPRQRVEQHDPHKVGVMGHSARGTPGRHRGHTCRRRRPARLPDSLLPRNYHGQALYPHGHPRQPDRQRPAARNKPTVTGARSRCSPATCPHSYL